MQCFLSNKQRNKQQAPMPIPRVIPTPPQPPLNTHLEFEKFATFSEGVILDELDRHYKEEKEKQKEIDELYKKLVEKDTEALKEREKEQEDEKKLVKVKLPLSKPDITGIGGLRLKTNGSSKKSLGKPSHMAFQSRFPRWH